MTTSLTVYIAGPMNGHENLNEGAFRRIAKRLKDFGHVAVVPHDIPPFAHTGECPPRYGVPQLKTAGHSNRCHLKADIRTMLTCDMIVLLNDWRTSVGATLEYDVALRCGIPTLEEGLLDVVLSGEFNLTRDYSS